MQRALAVGRVEEHAAVAGRLPHAAGAGTHDAGRSTHAAGAIVGGEDDNGIVELIGCLQVVEQATDLRVAVIKEASKGFLQTVGKLLLLVGDVVPGVDTRIARRKLSIRGDYPRCQLAFEPLPSYLVPPGIETTAVLLYIRVWRLMRLVHRAQGEIHEERLLRAVRLFIAQVSDCVINKILGDVVTLLRCAGRVDVVIVAGKFRIELVGGARQKAIVAVETTL